MFEYRIEDLKETFPLPEGVEDVVVNREQLADALKKSSNTIDQYRKKGMPVLTEGGNGTAYEFQLSNCWAWINAYKKNEEQRLNKIEGAIHQLRLQLLNDEENEFNALSPSERKKLYEAEKAYGEAAYFRTQFVSRVEVSNGLAVIFSLFKQGLESLPDTLERELGLSPDQVERCIEISDLQLNNVKEAIQDSDLLMSNASSNKQNLKELA